MLSIRNSQLTDAIKRIDSSSTWHLIGQDDNPFRGWSNVEYEKRIVKYFSLIISSTTLSLNPVCMLFF